MTWFNRPLQDFNFILVHFAEVGHKQGISFKFVQNAELFTVCKESLSGRLGLVDFGFKLVKFGFSLSKEQGNFLWRDGNSAELKLNFFGGDGYSAELNH